MSFGTVHGRSLCEYSSQTVLWRRKSFHTWFRRHLVLTTRHRQVHFRSSSDTHLHKFSSRFSFNAHIQLLLTAAA